jgi:hypothetical protein
MQKKDKYFVALYSDGETNSSYFENLQQAVREYSRDIMGHTLINISDQNGEVVWSLDEGYTPGQQMYIRAIDAVSKEGLINTISGLVKEIIMATAIDPVSNRQGKYAKVKYSFDNGVLVLKDVSGQNRRMFKISIETIPVINHKFGSDFICETCGKNMATIEDPTGPCDLIQDA